MKLSTKLLLVALSSAAGLFFGAFFSNSLKRKRDFFCELLAFIDSVFNDVSFKQDGVRTVAESFASTCKSKMKSVLEQYVLSPDAEPSLSFLSTEEVRVVSDFFSGLGKADIYTEKTELMNTRSKIEELCSFYGRKCDSNCAMFLKLGLLIGLAFGILIL